MNFDITKVEQLIEELGRVDANNLVNELAEHAAKYGWFAVLYEKAKAKEDRLKYDLKVLEAQLDKKYRGSGDKVTERMLEKLVQDDMKYQLAYDDYLKAKEESGILGAVVSALSQKKDLLISYVGLAKEELKAKTGLFDVEKRDN